MNLKRLLKDVIRGQQNIDILRKRGLTLGKNVNIEKGVIIEPSAPWLVKIGDNVTLAPQVYILAHDASTKIHLGVTKVGKVTIGNNVFVGARSIILPNVNIGNDVVIGAGSIVTKDIESNSVVVGNPARKICDLSEFIYKNKNAMEEEVVSVAIELKKDKWLNSNEKKIKYIKGYR